MKAQEPRDEIARLQSLRAFDILDTPPEQAFDDLVKLAAAICGTPIALISLVDSGRQWFKARIGLDVCETSREISFCAHALLAPHQILEVPDALQDNRFSENPLVRGKPHIRFYAGAPLLTTRGEVIGTLCVIDTKPHQLDDAQRSNLVILSRQVVAQLELRRSLHDICRSKELACKHAAQLAEAQRVSHTGSWYWEIGSDTVTWTDELFRIHGLKRQSVPVSREICLGCLHPDDRALCLQVVEKALQDHQPFRWEFRGVRPDGEVRLLQSTGEVILGLDGHPIEMLGTVQDITEQKAAQAALNASQIRYQTLFECCADAIFILGTDGPNFGRILSANSAAATMHGYSLEELLQLSVQDLDTPASAAAAGERFRQIQQGRTLVFEVEHRRKDGSVFPVEVTASPMEVDGEICVLAIDRDITTHKQAEQDLHTTRAAAEAANADLCETNRQMEESIQRANRMAIEAEVASRAKSEFLATMSHEIRTPMNGIIGFASLLAETDLTPDQHEQIDIIRSSGETLLTLINDILDFSKIEAGRMELEHAPYDLRATVQQTLAVLRARATPKNVELRIKIHPAVPATIVGDETRLRQVLLNLASNAIKFTECGEVEVEVRCCELRVSRPDASSLMQTSPPSGGEIIDLHFTVRDTGIGIPPDRLNRLFKSFSQVDSSTTRRYGGTGLGLVISKRLCELMGGGIHVESTPGFGSAFHFTIQVQLNQGATPVSGTTFTAKPRQTTAINGNDSTQGLRILLVEDNRVNQALAVAFLKKAGCNARLAEDGQKALDLLQTETFDLVLMDVCMPEMDGYEATQRIRAGECGPAAQNLYIAAMTANVMEGDRDRCLAAGMNDYLSKPIKKAELFALLTQVSQARKENSVEPCRKVLPSAPKFSDPRSF